MKYKIIKEHHTYSNNNFLKHVVYEKTFWGWNRVDSYDSFKEAENKIKSIFDVPHSLKGIIKVDGNVYTFLPFCLPLP